MNPKKTANSPFTALYFYSAFSLIALISILGTSFIWNYSNEHKKTIALARKETLVNFNKDISLRYWATEHGGVYVPITEKTPPNPYLSQVSERDIVTPSGRILTLMNPAYMIRQVMEEFEKLYGVKGHITSLSPINPANKPDDWEKQALKEIEAGAKEVFEISETSGKPFLRLIRPLITREGCLKCHGQHGYQVGDIRGGIGVSVPLTAYYKIEQASVFRLVVYHSLFGVLGLLSVIYITFQTKKGVKARLLAEEDLHQINTDLERRVVERTDELNTKYHELTESRKGERESENRFRDLVESMNDGFIIQDGTGIITFVNSKISKMTGFSKEEIVGRSALDFFSPDNQSVINDQINLRQKGIVGSYETELTTQDNLQLPIRISPQLIYNEEQEIVGSFGIITDISQQKQAEELIKASLEEKEMLLHEIHHRVKNNLTVISSLLSLQARRSDNDTCNAVLQDSQNRVQAMAMIHETLYSSDSLSSIDISSYFTKLVNGVMQSYGNNDRSVNFKVQTGNIKIDIKKATPLGLIVNELTTNILKYAYPDNEKGSFLIQLKSSGENKFELIISDDGIGIPEDFDWHHTDKLGIKLVKLMVENQLNGSINVENSEGTKYTISFPIDET